MTGTESASNPFIFGADSTTHVVCVEPGDRGNCVVFCETPDGITRHHIEHQYWLLSSQQYDSGWAPLEGNNFYRYRKHFPTRNEAMEARNRHQDLYTVYDAKENLLIDTGITYFKGMRLQDVSVLTFDIEATTLDPAAPEARTLIISNTYRDTRGNVERRMFCCDEYDTDAEMFEWWCAWVRDRNPSIVAGHNIYMYDLPYLHACARRVGTRLRLGRDSSALWFNSYDSKYRRDGSQFYTYRNAHIYGREIVDTFFLSMKYDQAARKYESYALKQIIKQENLEVAGRQHYDAGKIAANWSDPAERAKIKKYAEHDADDALSLFDKMVPAYFYLNQSIPKSFQQIINSASGSWLNSFLVRSYLQQGASVPKESEGTGYEGGISIGNPGVYRNVFKVDVASLYPSIILQYSVHDSEKDPRGHFLKMVEHFTAERLSNKRRAKETGDRYYSDLEQAQKVVINSAYGMLGTPGLNFNSPTKAAFVTEEGRRILTMAMDWATSPDHGRLKLVNADTDSISVSKHDESPWVDAGRLALLNCLNIRSPERIRWEDDGTYDSVVVKAAKNYSLMRDGKHKIKGGGLKGTLKEKALQHFMAQTLELLHNGNREPSVLQLYNQLAVEICNLTDINRWCTKKTVTEAVLNSSRTNEASVREALEGTDYQQGDKRYFYFDLNEKPKLAEHWTHDHHVGRLLKKLHDTAKVFDSVLDISQFPNYALKHNQLKLKELLKSMQSI